MSQRVTMLSTIVALLFNHINGQTGEGCWPGLGRCPPGQVRINAVIDGGGAFVGGCNCGCRPELADPQSAEYCGPPRTINYDSGSLNGDCSCNCPLEVNRNCRPPAMWNEADCACGCPSWAAATSAADCSVPTIFIAETCSCGCDIGSIGGPCAVNGEALIGSRVLDDCTCDTTNVQCPGAQVADASGVCGCPAQAPNGGGFFPVCELPHIQDPITCDCVTTTTTAPPFGAPQDVLCESVGGCSCPVGTTGTCTMTCDTGNDACKDGEILCNTVGGDCIVNCNSGSACAGAAKIIGPEGGGKLIVNCIGAQSCEGAVSMDGASADQLIVDCQGGQSCKGSLSLSFGKLGGKLTCMGSPDSCQGMTAGSFVMPVDVELTPNAAFSCIGDFCPAAAPAPFNNVQTVVVPNPNTPVAPAPGAGPIVPGPQTPINQPGVIINPIPGVTVPSGPQTGVTPPITPPAITPPQTGVTPITPPVAPQPAPQVPITPGITPPQTQTPPQTGTPPQTITPGQLLPPGITIPVIPGVTPPNVNIPNVNLPPPPLAPGTGNAAGGTLIINTNQPIPITQPDEIVICEGQTGECSCSGTRSCTIKCESQDACKEKILNCPLNHDCTVVCTGDASCVSATINGPNLKDLTANCAGIASCTDTTFSAQGADNVAYTCSAKDSCKGATSINCGNGKCDVSCLGEAACDSAAINVNGAIAFACSGIPTCPASFTAPPVPVPTQAPTEPCGHVTCTCGGSMQCFAKPMISEMCQCVCPDNILRQAILGDWREVCGLQNEGQIWDTSTCGCDCPLGTNRNCQIGQVFNDATCKCECPGGNNNCPGASVMNEATCQCECPPHSPSASDCSATGRIRRNCQCSCQQECPGSGQIQDLATCQCSCPPGTPLASDCQSGILDPLTCKCQEPPPPQQSTYCCHPAMGFMAWRGRCWGAQSEAECMSEPMGRCVWKGDMVGGLPNPTLPECHSNPPRNEAGNVCLMRDRPCNVGDECCSNTCRNTGTAFLCR